MPESNSVQCPNCGQPYFVQPHQLAQYHGRTINCTRCGRPFTVTAPPGMVAPAPPPAQPSGQAVLDPAGSTPSPVAQIPPPNFASPAAAHSYPSGTYPPPPAVMSGWAVASLVMGIVLFCVPLIGGALAAIAGIIGIVNTAPGKPRTGRGMAIAGLVLGLLSLLVATPMSVAVLLPALSHAREQANRVKCAANMRQVGMAILMYANENRGRLPNDLASLSQAHLLTPGALTCPAASSSGGFTAQTVPNGSNNGTSDYVYVGKGLTTAKIRHAVQTVVLYEPLGNHHGDGMNVCFADGHVEWLTAKDAESILDQAAAGTKPIQYPPPTAGGAGP